MNSLMIKAICIMTLLTMIPVGAYVSEVYKEEVRGKATKALYEKYNEDCEAADADEEWTSTNEQRETAWDAESVPCQDDEDEIYGCDTAESYGYDHTHANTELEGIIDSSSLFEEEEDSCEPAAFADHDEEGTMQEIGEIEKYDYLYEDSDCEEEEEEEVIIDRMAIAEEEQSGDADSEVEESISIEVKDVEYGDDKVWLSARVHNPTGAHIPSAGFYATTPAGAHAGDDKVIIDTAEKEFQIQFELEGFKDAPMMGPEFKYILYVMCDGERITSAEHSFIFPKHKTDQGDQFVKSGSSSPSCQME